MSHSDIKNNKIRIGGFLDALYLCLQSHSWIVCKLTSLETLLPDLIIALREQIQYERTISSSLDNIFAYFWTVLLEVKSTFSPGFVGNQKKIEDFFMAAKPWHVLLHADDTKGLHATF